MSANDASLPDGNLGRALMAEWGHKRTYTAKGWHAQVSQLTAVIAGARAAAAVGLTVTQRTLIGWLSQTQEPSAANRRKIAEAYRMIAGKKWDPNNETRTYSITGEIDSGDRIEDRTLEIGLGDYTDARWDRIAKEFDQPNPDPRKIEKYFIEDVIVEDIGDTTGQWGFPGASYIIG